MPRKYTSLSEQEGAKTEDLQSVVEVLGNSAGLTWPEPNCSLDSTCGDIRHQVSVQFFNSQSVPL